MRDPFFIYFLFFYNFQRIRILRHQQPEPAEPVGLEPAQPDNSAWTTLLSLEPQAVRVGDPQDVGESGHAREAGGGRLPEQWRKRQL